ncbi:MAG: winged helix-turn helix family protein [Rhodospirillales bacterium]|nr:winged helix-turn helix family protein [Rhodospirillales bacterium]
MTWHQGRSYSADLRVRVLAAVDSGVAVRAVAPLFQVSISYIYKALIRRRRTGVTVASSVRGHRPRKLTPLQESSLVGHVKAHPDLTLAALQSWIESEHGVRLSSGAVWVALDRLGLSFKKNAARTRDCQDFRVRAGD